MNDIISAIIQTSVVAGTLIYVGKLMLDKLVQRSEELEKVKERQIELNVKRIEKAHETMSGEIRLAKNTIDELKMSVIKIQHKLEAGEERSKATSEELQRFVAYADKVIKDVERSNIIELGKALQMIKTQRKS